MPLPVFRQGTPQAQIQRVAISVPKTASDNYGIWSPIP